MASSVADFLVDFGKEEEGGGGGRPHYKPGTYKVKVVNAKPTISEQKQTPGLEVTFAFVEGEYRKKKLTDTLWNSPKAYSRFRLLLEAVGAKVPKKVNASKIAGAIKGKELYVEIEDEEREGYDTRSRVGFRGFINVDNYEAEDVEDEDAEDEDVEDEEDEDLEDEEDEDEEDEEDEDEEDEEEEPEPPKKRSRSKRSNGKPKASSKKSSRKRKAADDDEDEDLSDLDLDEF